MTDLTAYLGVVALITITPGADTAMVVRNTLRHGRAAGVATAAGSASGLLCWGVASAAGITALLAASATAFTILKLAGAAYLVYLGAMSIWHAGDGALGSAAGDGARRAPLARRAAARQGLLTNLLNPKAALFFTALLPQFVDPGGGVLAASALLTAIAAAASFLGLCAYGAVVARGAQALERPRVRRALDRATGAVLVALGVRVALERR